MENLKLGVAAHACNPSIQKVRTEGLGDLRPTWATKQSMLGGQGKLGVWDDVHNGVKSSTVARACVGHHGVISS